VAKLLGDPMRSFSLVLALCVGGCVSQPVAVDAPRPPRAPSPARLFAFPPGILAFLDGVEVDPSETQRIASDRIERIEVLKGRAAIALYGSRAANGVILVTTKGGVRPSGR